MLYLTEHAKVQGRGRLWQAKAWWGGIAAAAQPGQAQQGLSQAVVGCCYITCLYVLSGKGSLSSELGYVRRVRQQDGWMRYVARSPCGPTNSLVRRSGQLRRMLAAFSDGPRAMDKVHSPVSMDWCKLG